MEEMKFNNESIREMMKTRITDDIVNTVRKIAETGEWESPVDTEDDQIKSAMNYLKEMRGSIPQWFCIALDATSTVAKLDESKGFNCVSALYASTQRAPDDMKAAALAKLVELLRRENPCSTAPWLGFNGIGR